MAQGLWALLIPHGLQGGALSHKREDGEDDAMGIDEDGWQEEYLDWWFEHLKEKGVKGVSKDVWQMVSSPPISVGLVGSSNFIHSSWNLSAPLTRSLRSTI